MNPIVILLIIVSAAMHAYWNYTLKKSINKGADSVLLYWFAIIFGTMLFSIPFIILVNFYSITAGGIFLAALFGLFASIYLFTLSKSYQYGDLSQIYPLAKITPLFTLLIGIFYLGERLSLIGLFGVILVVLGVYFIHLRTFKFRDILSPLVSIKNKGSFLALVTAIISAFYGLFSKLGTVEMNPFIFMYFAYIFLIVFYIPLLFFKKKSILPQIKEFKGAIIKIGFFDFFAYLLVMFALSIDNLSYVFALRQMSILFSIFIGHYFLKEKYGKTRLLASIVLVAGVILVGIS